MGTTICDMIRLITAYRTVHGRFHGMAIATPNSIIEKNRFFPNDNRFSEKNEINIPTLVNSMQSIPSDKCLKSINKYVRVNGDIINIRMLNVAKQAGTSD